MAWTSLREIGLAYRSGKIDREQLEIALVWWRENKPPQVRRTNPKDPKRKPQHERDEIVALYASGLTLREVGVRVGVTPERIRQILIDEGYPRRQR